MEKGIIAAAGALVVVPISIWFYTSDHQAKVAATQLQPAPQPPAATHVQPTPQPPVIVQSKLDPFLRAKQAISERMRDPDSVKFGKLFEGRGLSGTQTICGEVNAKNGYGGYTGMTPFIYFIDTNLATTVELDPLRIKQITDVGTLEMMLIGLKAYRVDCRSPGQ